MSPMRELIKINIKTLLVKRFQSKDYSILLKHKYIPTGELWADNISTILDELHENFSRIEIRIILKQGDFKLIENNHRQIK